jgi:hypothetical protein
MASSGARRRKGIVLITTMLIMLLVVMLVTAVTISSHNSLSLSGNFQANQAALLAAESGIQYAMLRLRQKPSWRGNDPDGVPSGQGFYVQEDNGCVVGFLETPYGWLSQFRLRFNYYDGDGGADGLNDPGEFYLFKMPYVSVNNLGSSASRPVPRGQGQNYAVTDDSDGLYQVPGFTACIIAEGRGGPGMREADLNNPEAGIDGRAVAVRVVEAYLKVDNSDSIDAAMMAAGDIEATVKGDLALGTKDDDVPPRLRSRGAVTVYDENGEAGAGKLTMQGSQTAEVRDADGEILASYDPDKVSPRTESGENFYQLKWEDVRTARKTAENNYVDLAAGTYVAGKDGVLRYYDMSFADYAELAGQKSEADLRALAKYTFSNGSTLSSVASGAEGAQYEGGLLWETNNKTGKDLEATLRVSKNVNVRAVTGSDASGAATTVADFTLTVEGGVVTDQDGTTSLGEEATESLLEDLTDIIDSQGGYGSSEEHDEYLNMLKDYLEEAQEENPGDVQALQTAISQWQQASQCGWRDVGTLVGALTGYLDQMPPAVEEKSGDDLTADNLTLELQPEEGQSQVVLSADGVVTTDAEGTETIAQEGNLRVEAQVTSKDSHGDPAAGTLTASGNLTLVGAGVNLSANPGAEEGLCLYARGNIQINTAYQGKGKANEVNQVSFRDLSLKGLIYTWGNFEAKVGEGSDLAKFHLQGALVAYGGDPSGSPGSESGTGNIRFTADSASVYYDSAYLSSLEGQGDVIRLERTLWAVR